MTRASLVLCTLMAIPAAAPGAAAAVGAAAPGRAGAGGGAGVRPPAVAGSWYPDRHSLIAAEVDRMVRAAAAAPAPTGPIVALVVPHAGWRYSGAAAAAAFRTLAPGDFKRVVIVGPSHHAAFDGFATPEVAAFRTPAGEVPVCTDVVERLTDGRVVRHVPGAHDPEHSIEIELPFLQERLESFCLVPILAGRTDPAMQRDLAGRLSRLTDGRTLFVFSSDFTHYGPRYGYTPFGPSARPARARIRELDDRAVGFLTAVDAAGFRGFLKETDDSICGREGIPVLLEMLPRIAPGARAVRLARYASIDIPGFEDDNSVTYVAIAYVGGAGGGPTPPAPIGAPLPPPAVNAGTPMVDADLGARLVRLARATIDTELRGTDELSRALRDLSPASQARLSVMQAAFVTINRKDPTEIARLGRLRGCIGQVSPSYTLPEAVVVAAANAALQDPRFDPVRAEELPRLEVEVSVLTPPRPIASYRDIEIGRHGIVLTKSGRRALFLPQVPVDEKWTVEETLAHLSEKAGLPRDAWREGASFEVFEGQLFEENGRGK